MRWFHRLLGVLLPLVLLGCTTSSSSQGTPSQGSVISKPALFGAANVASQLGRVLFSPFARVRVLGWRVVDSAEDLLHGGTDR